MVTSSVCSCPVTQNTMVSATVNRIRYTAKNNSTLFAIRVPLLSLATVTAVLMIAPLLDAVDALVCLLGGLFDRREPL